MANILTAIPDLLGKLATEHVSAEVQGKHIALLKEQFGILLRENAVLVAEKSDLKAENKSLKAKIKSLEKKNINLTSIIESHNSTPVKKWPTCPKCLEPTYQFTGEYAKPANDFFASVIRIPIHKCSSCGYTDTGK